MTKTYFKLVMVKPEEVHKQWEPHIVVVQSDNPKESVSTVIQGRPDWASHIIEGSIGVFNIHKLLKV